MTAHGDIARLLRIKHLREQHRTTALHGARAAERRAVQARQGREHALAAHEVERPQKEQAAYRRLAAGPVSTSALQTEIAQVSGLAAYSAVLREQVGQAVQQEAECVAASRAARAAHIAAMRESAAADLLHARLTAALHHSDECRNEAELEEFSGRRRTGRG